MIPVCELRYLMLFSMLRVAHIVDEPLIFRRVIIVLLRQRLSHVYHSCVPVNHQVLLPSILQRQQLGQTQLTMRFRLQQIGIDSYVSRAYRQHVTVKG